MGVQSITENDPNERLTYLETMLLQQKVWGERMKDVFLSIKENQQIRQRALSHRQDSALRVIRGHHAEFFDCFSLPGVKYVAAVHTLERFLWVLVILVSAAVSSSYILQHYLRWRDNPVLIGFNDSLVHVSYIPFPAVTVCPQRQTSPTKSYWNKTCLDRFSIFSPSRKRCWVRNPDYYPLDYELRRCNTPNLTCTEKEWMPLYAAHLLCPDTVSLPDEHIFDIYDPIIINYINKLIPIASNDVVDVRFNKGSFKQDSYRVFQTVFVEGEVCYTFNMLPADRLFQTKVVHPGLGVIVQGGAPATDVKEGWTPDTLYLTPDLSDTIPRHVARATKRSGLQFLTEPLTEKYVDVCTPHLRHFKVGLHHPAELPTREDLHYIQSLSKLDVHLRVTPHLTTTEDQLRALEPARRRCYFSDEQTLGLYTVYTQRNCVTECFVNCSLKVCGCIPFHLPRHNSSVQICHQRHDGGCAQSVVSGLMDEVFSWRYVVENFHDLLAPSVQDQLKDFRSDPEMLSDILQRTNPNCSCNCPHACTTLQYDADISFYFSEKVSDRNMQFTISFGDSYYPTILRKQFLGLKDVLAECGGVLGVFTGFSFIALSELIYFLTLRLWVTVNKSWNQSVKDVKVD